MNKFPGFAFIALVAATLACQAIIPTRPPAETSDLGCSQTLAALGGLHSGLSFPQYFGDENPAKQGGEFDPNRYFEAFTHLQMQEGYLLDYVYHQDGMGGYPVLYARPLDQAPYETEADYLAAAEQPDYLEFVLPQDTSEGYFEYAAFATLANQFYLDWHANYNDWQVLCDREDIENIIRELDSKDAFGIPLTSAQKRAARAIDALQPVVELTSDTAVVKMLVFTKWGGFYRRTLTIDRADHSILDGQDESLVEYDCGIAF